VRELPLQRRRWFGLGKMTERNKPGANTIRTLAILLDERIGFCSTLNAGHHDEWSDHRQSSTRRVWTAW